MYSATQHIFPKGEWERVNVWVSQKGEGNCLGIQFISPTGDYTLAVNASAGMPIDILRKLCIAVNDYYLKFAKEENK